MKQMTNIAWHLQCTGQSYEKRDIVFYTSFAHAESTLDTLILAAFHGDEPESEQLVSHFLQTFSPALLASRAIGVIPVVNPDGLQRQQRVNARSVDLNRNFPTRNWVSENEGTPYFSGTAPGSEPETQFLLEILAAYPPQKIISVHTPYKVINFDGPAKALAEAMAKENGYPVVEDIGYATPGSFGTYVGKERHIPTITLELPENDFNETELQTNLNALLTGIRF